MPEGAEPYILNTVIDLGHFREGLIQKGFDHDEAFQLSRDLLGRILNRNHI